MEQYAIETAGIQVAQGMTVGLMTFFVGSIILPLAVFLFRRYIF